MTNEQLVDQLIYKHLNPMYTHRGIRIDLLAAFAEKDAENAQVRRDALTEFLAHIETVRMEHKKADYGYSVEGALNEVRNLAAQPPLEPYS